MGWVLARLAGCRARGPFRTGFFLVIIVLVVVPIVVDRFS